MNKFVYHPKCLESPPYLEPFEFERSFDIQKWSVWMSQHWHYSIYASLLYVGSVFSAQIWMTSKSPFKLKKFLVLWNLGLCVGSFIMFSRLWPELWYDLTNHGVKHAVCNGDNHSVTSAFWCFVFTASKILEFGDTFFIVARKQNLIFLHWYHHTTVAIYCFAHFAPFDSASRWFSVINAFIHTIMYGYYALKAMEIKVPKQLSKIITTVQIAQMFIGVFVNLLSYYMKVNGERCDREYSSMIWALLMYGSYLILFVQFFKSAYNNPRTFKNSTPVNKLKYN